MADAPAAPKLSERDLRRERRRQRQARLQRDREVEAAAAASGAETPPPTPKQSPAAQALARIEPGEIAPPDEAEAGRAAREVRMREIRNELRRRRRLRTMGIMLRFMLFVILPTAVIGWYYYTKATDMYVSRSALIFKSGGASGGAVGGLFNFGGLGNLTDSVSVQEYITSRDILKRLDREEGYIAHFQNPDIDELHRLKADANFDDAYTYYKGGLIMPGKVKVSFDAAEGLIRLETVGATPEAAERFNRAIIAFAEEKVNELNERSRNDGVRFAEIKVKDARAELLAAQRRVAEKQEQLKVFSVEAEATVLQSRISALEAEIDGVMARIEKLRTVARNPNDSRFVPLQLDLEVKTRQLRDLRARLTGGEASEGPSMAQLSSELEIARVEQATANLMYTSALSSLETAIATASSQSLYLETVVQPGLPVSASKPERLVNTGLAFLVLFAAYILALLTISLIREQAAI